MRAQSNHARDASKNARQYSTVVDYDFVATLIQLQLVLKLREI
jgi:hypothetical protein